jgi:hypothetical protein
MLLAAYVKIFKEERRREGERDAYGQYVQPRAHYGLQQMALLVFLRTPK